MSDKIRLSLDVSPELYDALDNIALKTHSTKSDVLRKSVALMDLAVRMKEEGNHISVTDNNNKIIKEIVGL